MNKTIKVKVLDDGFMPTKAYTGDMGYDLYTPEDFYICNGMSIEMDCKIQMELPEGYGYYIKPRGGLGRKGIDIHAGVVDNGYRGNVIAILHKHPSVDRKHPFIDFKRGDKIAQMVIHRIYDFDMIEVDELSDTERGEGRYGSSDKLNWKYPPYEDKE